MPCRDERDSIEDSMRAAAARHWASIPPAGLCAILTAAEKMGGLQGLLDTIDFVEAGITREELLGWWEVHKKQDAARRAKEAEAARVAKLREEAIGRLTPEMIKVLGIKP